jgi:hypothetical protein
MSRIPWLSIALSVFLATGFTQAAQGQALIALLFGKKISNPRMSMGLELGLQLSTISNIPVWRPRSSFAIGAYTDIQLGRMDTLGPWSVSIYGLFKSSKGVANASIDYAVADLPAGVTDELRIERRLTYFEILPLLRREIRKHMFVGFGPDIGIRTVAKDDFIGKKDKDKLVYTQNVRDYFNPFDLGLALSFQYRFRQGKGLKLTVHYAQGLTNIYKGGDLRGVNCEMHIGLGIPLTSGASKSSN